MTLDEIDEQIERLGRERHDAPVARELRVPVTGLGKIDRKALRAPYWQGRTRGVA